MVVEVTSATSCSKHRDPWNQTRPFNVCLKSPEIRIQQADGHQKKKQQIKTLPPLLHSLLLFRRSILPTCVFFQLNSEFTALPLRSPLLFWTVMGPTKRECCTETEMSGMFHLRQSCTRSMEPSVKTAVDSCRVPEGKWWPGVQHVLCAVGDPPLARTAHPPEQCPGSTAKRPHWKIWPSLIWNKKNHKTIEKHHFKEKP